MDRGSTALGGQRRRAVDSVSMSAAPSQRPAAGKREAILRAALELFAERSFDGTPMPLVAARAGVGAGTVYRYFESKEALGNAAFRACKESLGRVLVEELPAGLPAREHFRRLWEGLARYAAAHPAAFHFLELQHHEDYLDPESRAASAALSERVADWVREAQGAGAVRGGPPEQLIALALGAFVGLVKDSCAGRFAFDEAAVARGEEAVWALLARPAAEGKEPSLEEGEGTP
jgi:AcrR family transcriptional regulator